jgi:hypothetical protein
VVEDVLVIAEEGVEDVLVVDEEEVEDCEELEVVVTENGSRFDGAGVRKVLSVGSGQATVPFLTPQQLQRKVERLYTISGSA